MAIGPTWTVKTQLCPTTQCSRIGLLGQHIPHCHVRCAITGDDVGHTSVEIEPLPLDKLKDRERRKKIRVEDLVEIAVAEGPRDDDPIVLRRNEDRIVQTASCQQSLQKPPAEIVDHLGLRADDFDRPDLDL